MKTNTWYPKSTGSGGQGLIIGEKTGANIAVAYDEKDAPLLAAAPDLLRHRNELKRLLGDALCILEQHDEGTANAIRLEMRSIIREIRAEPALPL